MNRKARVERNSERGIALITALMVSAILLGLGMAIALSVTTDTMINNSQRFGEQAFFAADAGAAIARRALATAMEEELQKIRDGKAGYGDAGFVKRADPAKSGDFPQVQVIPDPVKDPSNPFFLNVYSRAQQLADLEKRNQRFSTLNGSSFSVTDVEFTGGSVEPRTTSGNSAQASESAVLRYTITVRGTTAAGGSASVTESGRISTNLTLTNGAAPGTDRSFSFSGFGAFFDSGDTGGSSALASGSFSGPVHTNTHFAFKSNRKVTFRNAVTQVEDFIRLDSADMASGHVGIPGADTAWIDISAEGYQRTKAVPLPDNNFSQEYAVINSSGITDLKSDGTPVDAPFAAPVDGAGNPLPIIGLSGRVTTEALQVNLRDAANKQPALNGAQIANGVYISSGNGTAVTGAGIYVQGDASDIQLYANGTDQVFVISQASGSGTVTTTITVSQSLNQTTIDSAGKRTTLTGVPTDKTDPKNPRPGCSLFVNGSVNSLRGGVNGSTSKPAIASGTRLTITAQRDITITGDLKYADAVANSDGTPVANVGAIQNVLGIFTNDGNVNLAPNANYVAGGGLSLEMNAAVVAFNKSTQNDGSRIEGSITYTGSTGPGSTDKWKLVGSRVQSRINNIGYTQRDIFFDGRFDGGKFAPPFFPGTNYDLGKEATGGVVAIATIATPNPTSVSWYRVNK